METTTSNNIETTSNNVTLQSQIDAINSITTLEDIEIAYATLRDILVSLQETDDLSIKLVNYQTVTYLARTLNRQHLCIIGNLYKQSIDSIDASIKDMFKSYVGNTNIEHKVQKRQDNVWHIEVQFADALMNKQQAFLTISIAVDSHLQLHDMSVIIAASQCAASCHDTDTWYNLFDKIYLQRLVMLQCQDYDKFSPIVESAINAKTTLNQRQQHADELLSTLMEDFSTDMYDALAFIADATLDFCMHSLLPRQDGKPGFEMCKYRVSNEKIHNINVDTSIAIFDADGEIEVPEEFVRFESIRKRELQAYCLNKLAFITNEEFVERFDDTNMLHWLQD